jgi:hypothetical protein
MSRTVQVIASRVLLSITLIFALTQMHVFAQNYTWRNVQIVGGGFIVGVVFNQTEPNLVYTRTDIGGAYRLDNATSRWVPLLDSISWLDYAELTPAYIVRAANGDTVNCEKSLAISTDGGTTGRSFFATFGTHGWRIGRSLSNRCRQDRLESRGRWRFLHDWRRQDMDRLNWNTGGRARRVRPREFEQVLRFQVGHILCEHGRRQDVRSESWRIAVGWTSAIQSGARSRG